MYFSEIAPTRLRGAVVTAHQLGITMGILLAQVLTMPSLFGTEASWRHVFIVPVLCSLLELLVLPFCPESPAYLYKTQARLEVGRTTRMLSDRHKLRHRTPPYATHTSPLSK